MAGPKIGEAAGYIIEQLRDLHGDFVIEKEHAAAIWGGTKAVSMTDATDVQLLQYALLQSHAELRKAFETIASIQAAAPNRASRRATKKN
jgi:hypothetical protein